MKNEPTVDRSNTETVSRAEIRRRRDDKIPERFQHGPNAVDGVDPALIDKTKNQIRNLVAEIAELSKSSIGLTEFFEGFLIRTTGALASEGGAIWLDETGTGQLDLQYHVNMDQSKLATDSAAQIQHSMLLEKLRASGEASLIPANSGSAGEDKAGNPTENLLIVGPLKVNETKIGLVEIFQRPGAGPTTQRGYLRFLVQMCEIASDFLTNRKIRNFGDQQILWQQIDSFVHSIHQGLDPTQTAFVIANEGRRIIDCDRVSVVITNGSRCQIKAVSGLDSIERRADQVKQLQKLTRAVVKTNEPLWYSGDDEDLPPQIEKRLHSYVDKSHSKMLAIIPLESQIDVGGTLENKPNSGAAKPIIGALIVEQLKDSTIENSLQKRIEVVCKHSESALSNSLEHNGLFLMPLWKSLGKMAKPFSGSQLPKTLFALTMLGGIIAFFSLFPYPFTLSSNGNLQPIQQHEVYAKVGGTLEEVFVTGNDSERVKENDVLARITSNDLDVQIQNLSGQIKQTREQIRKFRRAIQERLSKIDNTMLDGELQKSEQQLISLTSELELKRQQAANLLIRSPADGVIVNWQIRKNLLKRPVDRGQNLMTVVNPDGGWQLEIDVPERRVGHLINRLNSSDEPIEVMFALVSHPGKEFTGTLIEIDKKLEVYSDDGNCAKAVVGFDNEQIPLDLLKTGTRVNAKLYCGTRTIGFVWFHELFETVGTAYKYWF